MVEAHARSTEAAADVRTKDEPQAERRSDEPKVFGTILIGRHVADGSLGNGEDGLHDNEVTRKARLLAMPMSSGKTGIRIENPTISFRQVSGSGLVLTHRSGIGRVGACGNDGDVRVP